MIDITFDEIGEHLERGDLKEWLHYLKVIDKTKGLVAEQTEPSRCERIHEGGVSCARYPACDDCAENPLNKVKGSERSVKGSDPLHDDCFDCDKFFTCDNKGEDYKTDCPWK